MLNLMITYLLIQIAGRGETVSKPTKHGVKNELHYCTSQPCWDVPRVSLLADKTHVSSTIIATKDLAVHCCGSITSVNRLNVVVVVVAAATIRIPPACGDLSQKMLKDGE